MTGWTSDGQPLRVVAGIVWEHGRYLAVQRPAGKHMAGLWEFPGGKVEAGETLEQALVRELHEELAIRAVDFFLWREKIHHYPDLHVHLFFFWVRSFKGHPRSREQQALAWVVPGADRLPFLQGDQEIVAALARRYPPLV